MRIDDDFERELRRLHEREREPRGNVRGAIWVLVLVVALVALLCYVAFA